MTASRHERLLDHLIDKHDRVAIAHLVEILPMGEEGLVWTPARAGQVVKLLGELAKQKEGKKTPHAALAQQAQRQLALLLTTEGKLSLSPRSTTVKLAAAAGMGPFLAQLASTWSGKERANFQEYSKTLGAGTIIALSEAWKNDATLGELVSPQMDETNAKLLTSKNLSSDSMKILRRGRNWTTQEADAYLIKRLWPDWQTSQSTKLLDAALNTALSQDGVPLACRVSPQAWAKTVFSGKYQAKSAKLFLHLMNALPAGHSLVTPTMPEEWQRKHLEQAAKRDKHAKHEIAFIQQVATAQVEVFKQQTTLDWELVRRVAMARTLGSTTKSKRIVVDEALTTSLREKMVTQGWVTPTLGLPKQDTRQLFGEVSFIRALPSEQLANGISYLTEGEVTHSNKKQQNEYHTQMTYAWWERMKEEATHNPAYRNQAMTHTFWQHFLYVAMHNSTHLSEMLPQLLERQHPVQGLLWDVLGLEVDGKAADPAMVGQWGVKGKTTPMAASAMKSVLLNLAQALMGRDHAPSVHSMRM